MHDGQRHGLLVERGGETPVLAAGTAWRAGQPQVVTDHGRDVEAAGGEGHGFFFLLAAASFRLSWTR